MALLNIYAGPTALKTLKEQPFEQSLFSTFLGASGGPKWFILAGLDKALFGHFFERGTGHHLNIVGSSAGAFRAACFGQDDPVAAITRLAEQYSTTVYSNNPSAYEITQKGRELLMHMMPSDGILQILQNRDFTVHFVTARCKGFMRNHDRFRQSIGLMTSALLNVVDRKYLKLFYERVVFSSSRDKIQILDPYNIPTQYVKMGSNTMRDALLASGSIPMVLEGIEYIVGAPKGVYRDGGIIDYHFDLSFKGTEGLTLYPHFYSTPIPGWFDKSLKSRIPHTHNYDNVVMLVPSDEFVASLPYEKIPDRTDFEKMEDVPRIDYWQKVIAMSDILGDYMLEQIDKNTIGDVVKPLPFQCQ